MGRPERHKQEVAAPDSELSEAEAACSPQERAFVHHLMTLTPERGFKVRAARLAGFKATTAHNLNSLTQRLLIRPRIIALIAEVTRKQIRTSAPNAVHAVHEILADRGHKDRLKAANVILERVDPTVARLDVNVRHEVIDRDKEAVEYLRKLKSLGVPHEKLVEELGFSALPRYERLLALEDASKAAPVIDADYSVLGGAAE
jgi:phage terminase small subunit